MPYFPVIAPHLGFVVLYRWRLHAGKEADFIAGWTRASERLRERGSLGSRLHRGSDGLWYSYAQWPDVATRERAFAVPVADDAMDMRMRAAIAERLPDVELAPVADHLVPAAIAAG